ncbi:MAG: hypothetical protein P8Y45_06400 [Exilibacterium sp.]
MKSYVENAYKNSQYRLVCQYSGVSAEDLAMLVLKNNVIAYELPKTQTLGCTWDFRLHLASGEVLAFSSKCTSVGGWEEVGSLSVALKAIAADSDSDVFSKVSIEKFYIANFSMLVYEEENVYSESGICFTDVCGNELIVAASPSPGAVSVDIPNIHTDFKPEFSVSDLKYKAMVSSQ